MFLLELKDFIIKGKILKWNIDNFFVSSNSGIRKNIIIQYIIFDMLVLILLAIVQYFLPIGTIYFISITFLSILMFFSISMMKKFFNLNPPGH